MYHKEILEEISRLATDIPLVGGARIAACLATRKGEIVSYGFNHRHTHPFQARYSFKPESIYWHAETHAIHNALKRTSDLSDLYLYIARVKHLSSLNKKWYTAKVDPCLGCQRCILIHDIRDVYSTSDSFDSLDTKLSH